MAANTFETIDLNKLEYKELHKNKQGGTIMHISQVPGSIDPKDRLRFQMSEDHRTNLHFAPWGLTSPMLGMDTTNRTLDVTIESDALLNFLREFDKKNLMAATYWFRDSINRTQLAKMHIPIVRPPYKNGLKSTVRVDVSVNERCPTEIYVVTDDSTLDIKFGKGYREGSHYDLTKGSKMLIVVESTGLWFVPTQFGCSLHAVIILVWPKKRSSGINSLALATM